MVEFKKIKIRNFTEVMCEYTSTKENGDNEPDEVSEVVVTKAVTPHDDFLTAMAKLAPHVLCLCEMIDHPDIADDLMLSKITVTGVSIGGSDEHEGCTIIAQKRLKTNKILNLNTPFTKWDDEHNGYEWAYELAELVSDIEVEAEKYLFEGKKKPSPQLSLFES